MSDFTKTYSNGEVTIVWKPDLCIHSTVCFRGLPQVFNPRVKPWINTDAATTEEILQQVGKCPSGALSILEQPSAPSDSAPVVAAAAAEPSILVQQTGPYLVSGPVAVKLPDGTEVMHGGTLALCSCGRSGVMPKCDCTDVASP